MAAVHSMATVSSGLASTGGFAFGAPGSEAFSSHSGLHSTSVQVAAGRPAMLPAVPEGLPSSGTPSALLHQRGYSAGPGCTGGFYMQRGADHAVDHPAASPFPGEPAPDACSYAVLVVEGCSSAEGAVRLLPKAAAQLRVHACSMQCLGWDRH